MFARCALLLFSRQILVQGSTETNGALLIVANHPNGFLDGIVVATRFRRPVCFLGRGDLFRHRFVWSLLKPFHILPLYSAGRHPRLRSLNEDGLSYCRKMWNREGIVLVFAEGETKPEWGLRELKKTAFRLADPVWQSLGGANLKMLAAGIHYEPFRGIGKNVLIRLGRAYRPELTENNSGQRLTSFQNQVRDNITDCLVSEPSELSPFFRNAAGELRRPLLFLPAVLGWSIHAPLYLPVKFAVNAAVKQAAFRESYLFMALFMIYPLYWIGINVSAWHYFHRPVISFLLLLMPLWARCYILRLKRPG